MRRPRCRYRHPSVMLVSCDMQYVLGPIGDPARRYEAVGSENSVRDISEMSGVGAFSGLPICFEDEAKISAETTSKIPAPGSGLRR